MTREIKFRAWEKPQFNDNADGSPAVSFAGRMWNDNDPKFWAECMMNQKDEYILMQYTGLKDKNGKEIYEGDIVQFPFGGEMFGNPMIPVNCEVKFEFGGFTVNHVMAVDGGDWWNTCEIIGNIYESPELLK